MFANILQTFSVKIAIFGKKQQLSPHFLHKIFTLFFEISYKKTNADFRFKPENQRFIISRDDWIRTSDNTPPRRVL